MEVKTKKKVKGTGLFSSLGDSLREDVSAGGGTGNFKLWVNLGTLMLGFLFGGCHLVFGAYPLGLAFISALPEAVWLATLGAVLGALTIGRSGIIYALICVLAVFLRVIISGNDKSRTSDSDAQLKLFSEGLSLRVSSAVISGFVAGIYELLLEGISAQGLLFLASMVILPSVFTVAFAGAFHHGIGLRALIFGTKHCFAATEGKRERAKLVYFRVSLLVFIALAAFALNKYKIFGIDPSFVFAAVITLFASKRFGALYGAVVGFVSSALVSGLYSPAFALMGAGGGVLFPIGGWYAVSLGCTLASVWGAYVAGVSGFLSIFPESFIASCIIFPILRFSPRERASEAKESISRRATDMVGTMALAYRNRQTFFAESAERAVAELAPKIDGFCNDSGVFDAYLAFARMLSEAKEKTLNKRELDESLTDRIEPVFRNFGFDGGIIRAFGDRMKYIICSGCDTDGTLITSPALKAQLEEACGIKLSAPEYYRRDDMVLMECEAAAKYKLEGAFACESRSNDEISGDSIKLFISKELFAYGLICDGMGSGAEARKAADFSSSFLEIALKNGIGEATALHMLNAALRNGDEECSVAADMFVLDLLSCEAKFIKSGGACSYVKRGASLFRIKSETMPLGLLRRVDAEQITASVTMGDYIIMLSDGACDPASDSVWLVELLNGEPEPRLDAYAERILSAARKNRRTADDMSVLVMKVEPVA